MSSPSGVTTNSLGSSPELSCSHHHLLKTLRTTITPKVSFSEQPVELVDDLVDSEPQLATCEDQQKSSLAPCGVDDDIDSLLESTKPPETLVSRQYTFPEVWQRWVLNERTIAKRYSKKDIAERCHLHKNPPLGFDMEDDMQVREFINATSFKKTNLMDDKIQFFDGHVVEGSKLRSQLKNLSAMKEQLKTQVRKPLWALLR